eukprot:340802-Hanusia_phi.AAC.2
MGAGERHRKKDRGGRRGGGTRGQRKKEMFYLGPGHDATRKDVRGGKLRGRKLGVFLCVQVKVGMGGREVGWEHEAGVERAGARGGGKCKGGAGEGWWRRQGKVERGDGSRQWYHPSEAEQVSCRWTRHAQGAR